MPKLLTRLKISEVSAVDRGAGENCEIMLMKRHGDAVAKATAALEESVASIVGCDDDDETKRKALAETFTQFQMHLDREITGKSLSKGPLERETRRIRKGFEEMLKADRDDGGGESEVTKTDSGPHHLGASLIEHLTDRLERHRTKWGYEKSAAEKESTMDNLTSISKSHEDLMSFCKRAVEAGEPGEISESALVEAVTKHACARFPNERSDVAFSKLFDASSPEGVLLRKTARLCRDGAWGRGEHSVLAVMG